MQTFHVALCPRGVAFCKTRAPLHRKDHATFMCPFGHMPPTPRGGGISTSMPPKTLKTLKPCQHCICSAKPCQVVVSQQLRAGLHKIRYVPSRIDPEGQLSCCVPMTCKGFPQVSTKFSTFNKRAEICRKPAESGGIRLEIARMCRNLADF